LRAFEQQKARLAGAEAKLKLAEKKARSRRLIEAGILIEKSGLDALATDALYGALLSLRSGAESAKQQDQWATVGARALAQDAKTDNWEPVVLTFQEQPDKEAAANLRSTGFRFNRVLRHWEGMANFAEAEEVAAQYGGNVRRISYSADQPNPS
jgi:hypothetical protein